MKKITKAVLDKAISRRGQLNKAQVLLLGHPDFFKGWKHSLIGKEYDDSTIERFLYLGDLHIKNRRLYKKELKYEKIKFFNRKKKFKNADSGKNIYLDLRWVDLRMKVLRRDNFACRLCGRESRALHVHHSRYIGENIWDTPMEYLITLCGGCHKKFHDIK